MGKDEAESRKMSKRGRYCKRDDYRVNNKRYFGVQHPWRIHVNVWQNQYSIVK